MKVDIFTVHYPDRDAAKLVYRELKSTGGEYGIFSCALESYPTRSKRTRTKLKIILAINHEVAKDLPSILRGVENQLSSHPLYPYISFESTSTPLSLVQRSFDCYDDENYQKIFKQKRERHPCI